MTVVIAGGGTAGHVNPAIALAQALRPLETVFIGTERGAEARLVPEAGFQLRTVRVRGFDRARPWTLPATAAVALRAIGSTRMLLKTIGPEVVVGMGGYVSLPAALAARMLGIPVVLHEQNIVMGLANRVAKPLARKVAVSFRETQDTAGSRSVYTGNPVRPEIAELDHAAQRKAGYASFDLDPARRTLLVFGGSQGARTVNIAAAGTARLWRTRTDLQVLHITGAAAYEDLRPRAADAQGSGLVYRPVPYVADMGAAYAVADLALCRGGATTVAELQAVGLPAIVVPYPYHRDRQQELHGRSLERRGAAVVLADADATPENVAELASSLLADDGRLTSMRASALADDAPSAADALAKVVREAAR